MSQSLNIQFDPATLKAGVQQQVQSLLTAQKNLGADAAAQLQSVAAQLEPLAIALALEEASGQYDTTRTQQYITGLAAIVEAEAAGLATHGIIVEKQQAASAIAGFATGIANALKDPTTQMLLKAAVGIAVTAL